MLTSSLVENGAGTGWTLKVKESRLYFLAYKKEKPAIKPHSMREKPSLWHAAASSFYIKRMFHSGTDKTKILQWLVGFTDGDGSFSIIKSGATYRLHYGLEQSYYNIRILYYIKSVLGYGSVTKYERAKMAQLRITDRKILKEVIFPIFDNIPLLTVKHFNYLIFKKAAEILDNTNLSTEEKTKSIDRLKLESLPPAYTSPGLKKPLSKSWLAGFIEAEGCFGIYPEKPMYHIEFTIVQKHDKLLLEKIKSFLHISSKVRYNETRNIYRLTTKSNRSVSNIVECFQSAFKGIKALEFKLWSKAFYYKKKNPDKLPKIHAIKKKLRGHF